MSLAGFASEAASKPENVEAVANALGLAEGQVAYAAATPGDTFVVEVEDETALAAAEVVDGAGAFSRPHLWKEGFAARCLIGDDALTAAVTTLGLYWTARSKLDVGPPLRLSIDGEALLSLIIAAAEAQARRAEAAHAAARCRASPYRLFWDANAPAWRCVSIAAGRARPRARQARRRAEAN